jgi:hypothetical protein
MLLYATIRDHRAKIKEHELHEARQAETIARQAKAYEQSEEERGELKVWASRLTSEAESKDQLLASAKHRLEEALKAIQAEKNAYHKYECPFCSGSGQQQVAGSVHMHPETFEADFVCDVCKGDGYLYKRKVGEDEEKTPLTEEEKNQRWAERYDSGAQAAKLSLQTTDPKVLEEAAEEKLANEYASDDHKAYWMGFKAQVVEKLDEIEEDMKVEESTEEES